MRKKWIAINLLLLGIAGLLGWQLRLSIRQFNAGNDPAKLQPARDIKQKLAQDKIQIQPAPAKAYLPAEFAVIPEKNIFSESRAREEKADIAAPPEMPPLQQKPILVGVTITDSQRRALIINSGPGQDRNRRAEVKRIGDVYQGYTITAITPENIVLESGTRREIIPLHEGSKRGSPGKTPILSTRVVPIGGGAASGGGPVSVVSGSGAVRTATVPVGSAASPSAAATTPPGGVAPRQAVPTASQSTSQPAASQPTTAQPSMVQPTSPQAQPSGTRVIRTPFGDVVRPNRN